jgi:hypothetical protein
MNCQFGFLSGTGAKTHHRPVVLMLTLACSVISCCFIEGRATHGNEPGKVLAHLGQQPITEADVDFQLGRRRKTPSGALAKLPQLSQANLQSTIHLIAQQRQALQTLRAKKLASTREDVEIWLNEHAQPADGTKLKVVDIVRMQTDQAEISELSFRDHIAFRLSWQRYLANQLNEKNIAKHFENHRKRFDGTRFRISTLAVPTPAGQSSRRTTVSELLLKSQSSLKDDSAKWDEVPKLVDPATVCRVDYWVRGTGDLDPTVVSALIKMAPGDISEPIHTPTAVQLVKLLEVEAGEKELSAVRDEVRAHMLVYLLDHLATQSGDQLPLKAIMQ